MKTEAMMRNIRITRSSAKKAIDFIFQNSSQEFFRVFMTFQGLVLFQQLVNVLSGYYLNQAINSIQNNLILKTSIGFFLLLILADFFLVIPIRIFEVRSTVLKYKAFLFSKLKASPHNWPSDEIKDRFISGISNKAYLASAGIIVTLSEVFRFSVSIVLNTFLFSVVLDVKFIYSILATVGFSFLYQIASSRIAKKNAGDAEESELAMFSYAQKSWDSVVLGNSVPAKIFFERMCKKIDLFLWSATKSYRFSEIGVFISATLSIFPLIVFDYYFYQKNADNFLAMSSLIVLLPRQVTIVNNVRALTQLLTFMRQELVAIDVVNESTTLLDSNNLESRISLGKISLNGKSIGSLETLSDCLKRMNAGRLTILGSNGSGKSSLLFYLAKNLENTFLLPASAKMETSISSDQLSVGQRVLAQLEMISSSNYQYVLLDEWDANLDTKNRALIDYKLKLLSQKMLILEVRH